MDLEIKGLKISQKLALILMFTAILTMSIIGFIYHNQSQATMAKLVEQHVNLVGAQIGAHLSKAIEQMNERTALISSRTQLRYSIIEHSESSAVESARKIKKILLDAQESISDIKYMGVYDVNKKLVTGTQSKKKYPHEPNENLGKINFIKASNNQIVIETFEPLHHQESIIGYIQIIFDFRLFAEALMYRSNDNSTQEMHDVMLLITKNKHALKTVSWQDGFKLTPLVQINPVIKESIENPEFKEIHINGKTYFSNTFVMPDAGLALLYKVDKTIAFQLIDEQARFLTYSIFTLVLLLVFVAYFAGKRISQPIVSMASVAHLIAQGDLKKRIEKLGTDELGVLGRTLNLMAENLTAANAELENRVNAKTQELIEANKHLVSVSQKLEKLSLTDGLTKLNNRRALDKRYESECFRAARDRLNLTVMMIDVDYFKKFNDLYGHSDGDECLKKVATMLSSIASRTNDFVARYGGEEFVLILPNTQHEAATTIADSIINQIQALKIPHADSKISEYVSVSIGCVSGIPEEKMAPELFIKIADKALYRAKKSGRNKHNVVVYPEAK